MVPSPADSPHAETGGAPAPARRRRRWLFRLVALGIAVLAGLFLGEIVLRVLGFSAPIFHQPDPVLGHSLIPGAEGWQSEEGRAWVEINDQGMRDRERARTKPPGTVRIAVLGDSFMEAIQVDLEQSFCARLEAELAARGRPRVEVLNFGCSGHGTGQALLALRKKVWEFEPDLVLLSFLTANDLSDNVRELKGTDYAPYFLLDEGGQLQLDQSFLQSAIYQRRAGTLGRFLFGVHRYSRLAQALNLVRRRRLVEHRRAARDRGAEGLHPIVFQGQIYRPPEDEVWTRAWRVTEALLGALDGESRAKRVPFCLMILSNAVQVAPNAELRDLVAKQLGVPNLEYPDRRLAAFAEARGIPVLPLVPGLRAHAEKTGVALHGFPGSDRGHWNAEGHQAAARLAAPWLEPHLPPR